MCELTIHQVYEHSKHISSLLNNEIKIELVGLLLISRKNVKESRVQVTVVDVVLLWWSRNGDSTSKRLLLLLNYYAAGGKLGFLFDYW
jgi:hypothetical protein